MKKSADAPAYVMQSVDHAAGIEVRGEPFDDALASSAVRTSRYVSATHLK
jgi:hypothetical protein